MAGDRPLPSDDLEHRIAFEALISELSSRFIHLAPGEVDGEIEEALRRVCEPLGIDRALLWQQAGAAPEAIRPTHAFYAEDSLRDIEPTSPGGVPWIAAQLRTGRTVAVPAVEQLPEEAAVDRESLLRRGIRSGLFLPLTVGGEPPVGALALTNFRARRDWPEALVKRLSFVAQIFAGALARRRADRALRESEARLAAAAGLAGLGFYDLDLESRTFFVDERLQDLCGFPPDSLGGLGGMEHWLAGLHPGDRARVLELREKVIEGRLERLILDYRFLHPTRGERWLHHITTVVRRDAEGRAVRTSGVLRDVTEQRRAENEIRALSQRLIRAHEEERARLARELHDDLTQRLAVLAIEVGRAELAAPEPAQAQLMRSIRQSLVRLGRDIHSLASQLHPRVLDELGLGEALRAEGERLGSQGRVDLALDVAPLPAVIDKEVALCLFRVAQGAMSNVIRHARARTMSVALQPMDGGLRLAVRDDGVGFDPASPATRASLGLASMRERVGLVNGALEIESAPGRGTTVTAWVPASTGAA